MGVVPLAFRHSVMAGHHPSVMAGLVPAIRGFELLMEIQSWMAGTRPAMTG
jgi:hypothetical protein